MGRPKSIKSRLRQLQASGARVIETTEPESTGDDLPALKKTVDELASRVDVTEKVLKAIAQASEAQIKQIADLIKNMPSNDNLPLITGLRYIKDEDGISTEVEFIREKRSVN